MTKGEMRNAVQIASKEKKFQPSRVTQQDVSHRLHLRDWSQLKVE